MQIVDIRETTCAIASPIRNACIDFSERTLSLSILQDGRRLAVDANGRFDLDTAVKVEGGHVVLPALPGIGFEGKNDLMRVMRELAQ